MHRTMQYQWPGWRNIRVDGETFDSSVNLDEISEGCCSWRYLDDAPRVPRAPGEGYIPQIDGNYTLPSGPAYRDYGDIFTDSELNGDASHGQVSNRVFFVPPRPRGRSPPPSPPPPPRREQGRARQFLSRIFRRRR